MLRYTRPNYSVAALFLLLCLQTPSYGQEPLVAQSAAADATMSQRESVDAVAPPLAPSFARAGSLPENRNLPGDQVRSADVGGAMAAPPAPSAVVQTDGSLLAGASSEFLKAQKPLYYVYEFGAKWCPSCRDLAPFVHQVAAKHQGFAEFIFIDIDDPSAKQIVKRAGLRAIPTVVIGDRQGVPQQTLVGLQQGMKLDKILNDYRRRALAAPVTQ